MDTDLRAALRFANERRVRDLLGDRYSKLLGQFADEIDHVHEGLTSAIWAGTDVENTRGNIVHYMEEAARLRRFLG